MNNLPYISIVIPVRNEELNLSRLLTSLKKVDYPQEKIELIIVDGDSSDSTVKIAKKYKGKIVRNPKKIRGAGCRIGIEAAEGEYIAFTDADCVVPKDWVKGLLECFNNEKVAAVGGPNNTPEDDTNFSKAAGEVLWLLTRFGARYGYSSQKVVETYHNPGCNVLYRKSALLNCGNYNSDLLTCEDEEMDYRLLKKGYKILFTPKIAVDHYRRPTYKRIYVQAYRFAVGRVQAIKLHWHMARWFHFGPSFFLIAPLLILMLPASVTLNVFLTLLYLFGMLTLLALCSFYLVVKNKRNDFLIYFRIILCWFFGWGLGFIRGVFK